MCSGELSLRCTLFCYKMIAVFSLAKVTVEEDNVMGREMFEYRQLALCRALARGSEFICGLMKLWSPFLIAWVQNSLVPGCAACKVFATTALV